MSKIQSIHINNFKFFGESEPIVLDGKNILLYGENGSGKSSIYNALYTLLEAASKEPAGVQKYFSPLSSTNSESLVNIHAAKSEDGQCDSYIEVIDDQGNTYRISHDDTALCGDDTFMESQRACGFINYQSLFHFQLFRNSEESNLHEVFKHAIIPYLPCSKYEYQGKEISTVYDLFKAYLNYQHIKVPNHKGKLVIYKKSELYKNYLKLQKKINDELKEVIYYVNEQLPFILKKLGYTFNAYLRYTDQRHDKYDMRLEFHPFGVYLEIDEYEGQKFNENAPIKHPNVFLNEAKMSALAFAIRWAILTKPAGGEVAADRLRIVVLDDLMISLDMGNRRHVIRFLLNDERAQETQLLFFTHERKLFEFFINELKTKYDSSENKLDQHGWIIKELYYHFKDGHPQPVMQPYKSNYGKAITFFNGHDGMIDYCACGNALRKAIEEEFKRIYAAWGIEYNGETITIQSKLMIQNCIDIARKQFALYKVNSSIISDLQYLSSFVLNPASHYDPDSNFYRAELEDAFDVYHRLCAIRIFRVIPCDKVLKFSIRCSSGNEYFYEMDIFKSLMANINTNQRTGELLDIPMQIKIREVGKPAEVAHERKSLEYVYKKTVNFIRVKLHEEPIDKSATLFDEISLEGKPLNQILREYIERNL